MQGNGDSFELLACGLHDFCDTEIKQLHFSGVGHKDVAWLEVAMNHEIPVGITYGRADHAKQVQSIRNRKPMLVCVFRDRLALHIFHYKIRQPVVSSSAIEESRNIRVLKARENLTFSLKATQDFFGISSALE